MRGRLFWSAHPIWAIFIICILIAVPTYGSQFGDAARDRFLRDNPGATVNDGRLFDRPFSVSGFSPIESGGDYSTAFFSFLARNGNLFSAGGGRIGDDMLKSAFGPAQVVYSCDRDRMEPLPALIDNEFYEPRCAEFTIVKFPQMIDGLPFITRAMLAVFDKFDRLIAVQGEFVGGLRPDAAATVSEEQAAVSIETEFDADPSSLQYEKAELQYRYIDGIIPVWSFSRVVVGGRTYAEIAVDADSGAIVSKDTGIDHDPGNIDVWGHTLDDEAAFLCNEPALRKRRARSSFSQGTNRRAFNDNIHVYDLKANPNYPRGGYPQGDTAIQTLITNDVHLVLWKKFNYKCAEDTPQPNSCSQGFTACNNDDAAAIHDWDISTFTAFVHANNAFDYVSSMGFDKEGGQYPDGHSLAVIVNKTGEGMVDAHELCYSGGSCFTDEGFPVLNDGEAYNDYVPWHTSDRYDYTDPDDKKPTIVVEGNTRYCRSSAGQRSVYRAMNHPVLYHEFYHYVVRRYLTSGGYVFNVNEDSAINEGLAKYFGVTMEEMSPDNFHRSQLACNSNDSQGGVSMDMNYQKTMTCCSDAHDGGMVLTQALWDLREGIGSGVTALGKDYVDLLTFVATVLLSGGEEWTLVEFRTLLADAATYVLAGDCPLGSYTQCVNDINAAFGNHGICTSPPCSYYNQNCSSSFCDDAKCFRTNSCTGAAKRDACLKSSDELLCCAEVCTNDEIVACGLFANSALCRADCVANLWSQELRECLANDIDYPGDCDACDGLV